MRIRQIKPAFWSDSKLAELPEATRLFYVGLWMLADDAGWISWDPAEAAHELYGYETRSRRERRVVAMLDELRIKGRVILHPCGHLEVPKLADHQRLAGPTKQVRTVFSEHLKACIAAKKEAPSDPPPHVPADPRDFPLIPDPVRNGKERNGNRNGNGQERSGSRAQARDDDGSVSEFRSKVPLESIVGGKR